MKQRWKTHDREGPYQTILANEQIGPRRRLTPEGFLLCEAVPIARTGWMVYGPKETPVKTNDSGYAMVHRDAETLFAPKTIASFVGKSVTDDHPTDGVEPQNWREVTVGTAHNLRQGTGDDADVLLADLLITDADTIRAVQAGKVEVSAGYDADYEDNGGGEGRQLNIIGNHIALVERGRCGPRCAIGDRQPQLKGKKMPTATVRKPVVVAPRRRSVVDAGLRQRMLDAMEEVLSDPPLMGGNEGDEDDAPAGGDESHVHVHLHQGGGGSATMADDADPGADPTAAEGTTGDPYEARFVALENGHKEILDKLNKMSGGDPAPTGDEAEPAADPKPEDNQTQDSKALETGFRAVVADAEVLVPGYHVPTFDSKAKRKVTVDSMCGLRRKVLDSVYSTKDGRSLIESLHGGPPELATLTCDAATVLFKATAGAKRLLNNRASTGDSGALPNGNQPKPVTGAMSISELNALHRKTYQH